MFNEIVKFQAWTDSLINKVFLRFIPKSVTPNQVTYLRLVLVPFVYFLLSSGQLVAGIVLFVFAASTDFIDGAMARTRHQITDPGKVIDPIADKLLIGSVLMYIGFQYPIVQIFVVFIALEVIAVSLGYALRHKIGRPTGANIYGKMKLILQAISVFLFLLGVIVGSKPLMQLSIYVLAIALVLACVAGIEVARRKYAQVKGR